MECAPATGHSLGSTEISLPGSKVRFSGVICNQIASSTEWALQPVAVRHFISVKILLRRNGRTELTVFEYVARRAGGKKGREEDSSPGKKRECTAGLVSLFCLFFKVSNVTKCSKICSFQGQGQILTEGLTGLWCICWCSGFVLSLFLLSFLILYQLYQPTGMKDNWETWHTKLKGHRWLHIFMLQRNDSRCLWQCGCITHLCQMFHNKTTLPVIRMYTPPKHSFNSNDRLFI